MNTNSELVAGHHYILGHPMYLVHVSITLLCEVFSTGYR